MTTTQMPLEAMLAAQAASDLARRTADEVAGAIGEMVQHVEYPCLGARSVFRRDSATTVVLEDMTSGESREQLAAALRDYSREVDADGPLVSFLAVFREPVGLSETDFERLLWEVLQQLHDEDELPWASGVDADPAQAHFAFSHAGTPYFIVGLHPGASRIARRAPLPTLVFNLHEQFETLRSSGGFERMRDTIRRRDAALQGETNPMAEDHGDSSEARQYSGRAVEEDWHAPFTAREDA